MTARASTPASRATGPVVLRVIWIAIGLGIAMQKGVNQALTQGVAAQAAATPATTIAILKGLEYGALGAAIAWLVPRYGTTLRLHLLCGLIAGLVFGGTTLAILSPMPAGVFVPRAINETLFPIGCALALWLGRTFISHKQTVEIST